MKTSINIFIFLLFCCVNNVYAISVYPMDNLQDVVNNNSFIYLNEGEYNINNLVVPDDVSIYGSCGIRYSS